MNAAQIKRALDEGDYFAAIGVAPDASRMAVESAAARLQSEYADVAAAIGEAVQLLTFSEKRAIYEIACQFRDGVLDELRSQFGDCIDDPRQFVRKNVWTSIVQFLRIEGGDAKIGPRGAASIARKGRQWVIEEALSQFCNLEFSDDELRLGRAEKGIMFRTCDKCATTRRMECTTCKGVGSVADEAASQLSFLVDRPTMNKGGEQSAPRVACVKCDGTGSLPCDCDDLFVFKIPDSAKTGAFLLGKGRRTNCSNIAILGHPVYTERPSVALSEVYRRYNFARNQGLELDVYGRFGGLAYDAPLDAFLDNTSEEFLGGISLTYMFVIPVLVLLVSGGIGALIGLFLHKVLWASVAGMMSLVPYCLYSVGSTSFRKLYVLLNTKSCWGRMASFYAYWFAVVAGPPVAALFGHFTHNWQLGLGVGGTASAVVIVFVTWWARIGERWAR